MDYKVITKLEEKRVARAVGNEQEFEDVVAVVVLPRLGRESHARTAKFLDDDHDPDQTETQYHGMAQPWHCTRFSNTGDLHFGRHFILLRTCPAWHAEAASSRRHGRRPSD